MNWIFGHNINTDLITPGRFNMTTDPGRLASIAFLEARPAFSQCVKPGDFIVAGENFGCGSSRETAVMALKACGISAVLACSFARIFYRNGMNLGLLLVITDVTGVGEQDSLELDLNSKELINRSAGLRKNVEIPAMMLRFYREGGILAYLKRHGTSSLDSLIR